MNFGERLDLLIAAWGDRRVSLPTLVRSLDQVVSEASDVLSPDGGRLARRTWGQIEIINALTLDSGADLAGPDRTDVDNLLRELRYALSAGGEGSDS
jgi:hypothetical protein